MDGKTFHPGQANNFYIFPAIGLATYVARPRRLTDECFIVAAEASADQVGPDQRAKGMLFPSQADILETGGDDRRPRRRAHVRPGPGAGRAAARPPGLDRGPALPAAY